jgi:hypothetical protein
MASLARNQEMPIYAFDRDVQHIYFRNDTEFMYKIVLVPKDMTLESFPQRSIVINANVEETICICEIVPGQCVQINKVRKPK